MHCEGRRATEPYLSSGKDAFQRVADLRAKIGARWNASLPDKVPGPVEAQRGIGGAGVGEGEGAGANWVGEQRSPI